MRLRATLAAVLLLIAAAMAVVAHREGRFTPGAPVVGVFARADAAGRCDEAPHELLVFTSDEMYAAYGGVWRRGRHLEHRSVWSAIQRPAVHLRAFTEGGGRIELLVEIKGAGGFEVAVESTVEPSGDRENHPRQAYFVPCAPPVSVRPWLTAP